MIPLQARLRKASENAPRARTLFALLLGLILGLGVPVLARAAGKPVSSDGWPEITDEERKLTSVPQDPEAEAVVLRTEREGKMLKPVEEWVNQLKYHWRLKVLKPAGKDFGEVHIRGEKYSRVSNIEARTIKPDGTVVPVSKDQIFDKTVFQVGDFKIIEKVFNFPAVEPGAILEYRYERNDNHFFSLAPWYFEGPVFTLFSRVTQAVPNGFGYMVMCDLCEGTKPEVSNWREGKQQGEMYTVTLRNLPGYREEVLMPPRRDVSPRLEMVLQTWRDCVLRGAGQAGQALHRLGLGGEVRGLRLREGHQGGPGGDQAGGGGMGPGSHRPPGEDPCGVPARSGGLPLPSLRRTSVGWKPAPGDPSQGQDRRQRGEGGPSPRGPSGPGRGRDSRCWCRERTPAR